MIDALNVAAVVRDAARLHAVVATGLHAQPTPWCDRLAELASRILHVPVVLLVLVERTRQIMPGSVGLPEPWQRRRETPLTHSICQYVVGSGRLLAVADVRRDPVLHTSHAIRDLGVAAYAGAPLRGPGNQVVGALCAIDVEPRAWTTAELSTLHRLAARCASRLGAPGEAQPPGPDAGGLLWKPAFPPALTLDRRPPAPGGTGELALTGRWSGEPVTAIVRTADSPDALSRFRRRAEIAAAMRRDPPRVPVEEHRWHDDRVLVVSRAVGEPLHQRPDRRLRLGGGEWAAVVRAAALLSTWQPRAEDARRWTVDYPAWINRYERAGHLTPDEAGRLTALLRRCEQDRTFAHGDLTLRNVIRLPSRRLTLKGFAEGGMYLAGCDLAALAHAAPDAACRWVVRQRAVEADIVEPFAINLLLRAAGQAALARPAASADRLARLLRARRDALGLLRDLGV
ncbi:GAF domain-containing protein [Dactylosporangium sp. NPDC000244]|uniref:GAF domain-containing protein n=1 Tax=Dactylosporangium sp. NPDC000244 TaxID=3154365 RepID=UPI003333E0D5